MKKALAVIIIILPAVICSAGELELLDENLYASEREKIVMDISGQRKIAIHSAVNLGGELKIKADTIDNIIVTYRKIIKANDADQAEEFAKLIIVETSGNNESSNIFLKAPNPAPWSGSFESGRVSAEIRVPAGSSIFVDGEYFDIDILGPFDEVVCEPTYGLIKIRKVSTRVDVAGKNQRVYLQDISGNITVNNNNADIKIVNMSTGQYPARINNEYGDIILKEVAGPIDVFCEYGKVRISDLVLTGQNNLVSGTHSHIKIEIVEAENSSLEIKNANEDVVLLLPEEISGLFDLNVGPGGDMHMVGIPVYPLNLAEDNMRVLVGDSTNMFSISIDGDGSIDIEGEAD